MFGGTEAEQRDALVAQAVRLAREGVDFLQLREKDLPAPELAEVLRRMLDGVRAGDGEMKILVNSRLDVASSIGADGVHLSGAEAARAGEVRAAMPGALVSVSCHTVAEVLQAHASGADMALFGPVFGKMVDGVEVVEGTGLERLREACAVAPALQVFALGGVTAENAAACVQSGAAGVAAIRLFLRSSAPDSGAP